MFGQLISLYKAIHGDKLQSENIHHQVDWKELFDNIVMGDSREKGGKEV